MDLNFVFDIVEVHKNATWEFGQYPAILTLHLLNDIYLLVYTHSVTLVVQAIWLDHYLGIIEH